MREEYKGYYLVYTGYQGYALSNVGKGVLPNFLKGHYTTPMFAKQQIDAYLEIRGEKSGKTTISSRD